MLKCLLIWKPSNGAKPRCIQIEWYVADMPGPAILGLPTSVRLKVITLKCAVRITHGSPKLLNMESYNIVRDDVTSPHPVAQTPKSGNVSSKEQLIKDYPDCFEGIGRFPRTYKIHLKGCKPSNSSPVKMANCKVIKAEDKAQSDGKGWHSS